MFDKKTCMDNIYAIAKDKGVKIGELEKRAGLSTGYLSKLSKEGNTAVPGIESLSMIADALEVSIDYLISVNYRGLNNDEKYFSAFIEKLIKGTESGKIAWEMEGAVYLNSNDTGEDFVHPLFQPLPSVIEDPASGELVDYVRNIYQSRFLSFDDLKSFGNCYHCELTPGGDLFYMMKIYLGNKHYPKKEQTDPYKLNDETELYIVDKYGKVDPLCSTFYVGEEMKRLVEKLYSTVFGDNRHIYVSSRTKGIIDGFMDLKW